MSQLPTQYQLYWRKSLTKLLTTLVLVGSLVLAACAVGTVKDITTGAAVPNAHINWSDSAGNSGSVDADDAGLFVISGPNPADGPVDFQVTAGGYPVQTIRKTLVRNSHGFATVELLLSGGSAATATPTATFTVVPPTATPIPPTPTVTPVTASSQLVVKVAGASSDQMHWRADAVGHYTTWLHQGETAHGTFSSVAPATYSVSTTYSNDGGGDTVRVTVDGTIVGQFNTPDDIHGPPFGTDWAIIKSRGALGTVNLTPGTHSVVVTAVSTDYYGVEIDAVWLDRVN